MKNCLKTQLKESVQNESLPKLGEMKITFTPSQGDVISINNSQYSHYVLTDTTSFKIIGNGRFIENKTQVDRGKEITLNALTSGVPGVTLVSDDGTEITLCITPLSNIITPSIDSYFPALSNISSIKYIHMFKYYENIDRVSIHGSTVNCSLIDFLHNSLSYFSVTNTLISGDVSIIGNYPNLKDIRLNNSYNLYGTVESIVEGLAKNNFTDKQSVNIRFTANQNISFNNIKGVESMPYKGLLVISRNDNVFTVTQNNNIIGTYTIGSGWNYS